MFQLSIYNDINAITPIKLRNERLVHNPVMLSFMMFALLFTQIERWFMPWEKTTKWPTVPQNECMSLRKVWDLKCNRPADWAKHHAGMDQALPQAAFDPVAFRAKIQLYHPHYIAFTSKKTDRCISNMRWHMDANQHLLQPPTYVSFPHHHLRLVVRGI